jgi:imidazolonepropionase-like amidohydrolase
MKLKIILISFAFATINLATAQETFPSNGVKNNFEEVHAFINATLVISPQQTLENGVLIIQGDRIIRADNDTSLAIPDGAIIHDLQSKFIYPSFIDLNTTYGIDKPRRIPWKPQPQYQSNTGSGAGWNESIRPQTNSKDLFNIDTDESKVFRANGFGTVLTHLHDGIARGSGLLTTLNDENENISVLISKASAHYSLNKGTSRQKYPSSLMGVLALVNQTYLDAEWYNQNNISEYNRSLEAWNELQDLPQIFEVNDKLDIQRIWRIGEEFEKDYIVIGNGDEYQRTDFLRESDFAVVVPIHFPKPYDVTLPDAASMLSLQKMKHWEMAPSNPAILVENDIFICLTTTDLENKTDFLTNLRKAISYGLDKNDALAALTTNPAELIEASRLIGTLEKGKLANFIICSDDIFEQGNILSNWVQGTQYTIKSEMDFDPRGTFVSAENDTIIVFGSIDSPKAKMVQDSTTIKMKFQKEGPHLTFNFDKNGIYSIHTLFANEKLDGQIFLPNGKVEKWTANRIEKKAENEQEQRENEKIQIGKLWFPNMGYGWENELSTQNTLFKGATVWTNEALGISENTDVAISDGKIIALGSNLIGEEIFGKKAFHTIDAKGKHLTSGIIDEHSHIAISRGVNEGSQASSAEVSIQNVVNSDDVNIYRQLSGGVTTSQLLHGSANPIGGQSALIKLRWGSSPQQMLFENADGFIKFALGENVKQANWGDFERIRFPQTRMGVEQVFYDHFLRAKAYEQEWKNYNALSASAKRNTSAPREDLEMNALVEILNNQRFITCHSYVQSEINMLMHVGDSMGFTVNTFTHILEGYKVADKMKVHGAGASTFSDWWAYKFEVNDAIPYNAAILAEMDIVTAINSDDAEMARRLNQEAAKVVKYGNMSEEEAWKTVTLNPAKLLHIDHRVGSIKIGKDADIVLWSDNPLSVYAKVEQTYVDGKLYFDLEQDKLLQQRNKEERARLIQKMLLEKENGVPTQEVKVENQKLYHCDSIEGEEHDHHGHNH